VAQSRSVAAQLDAGRVTAADRRAIRGAFPEKTYLRFRGMSHVIKVNKITILMKRIFSGLIACLISVTSHATPASAPPGPPASLAQTSHDPVIEFKTLVAEASTPAEWSTVYVHSKLGKWAKQYYSLGQVKYDIKKTDSLLSPAMGIVSFPVAVKQSEFFPTRQEAEDSTEFSSLRITYFLTGQYFFSDGIWRVDQFSYYVAVGNRTPDPTTFTTSREQLVQDLKGESGLSRVLEKWVR
jgi:hypothetical protein